MTEEKTEETTIEKPTDHIVVEIAGKEKTIFMSAGLISIVATMVGEFEDFSAVYLDPILQERALVEVLVDRDDRGVPVEKTSGLTLMAFPMTTSEADRLKKWIGGHTVNFFMSGAKNLQEGMGKQEKVFLDLLQSLAGMNASLQETP